MTKATIYSTGRVYWEPPAVYKSACTIDVEYFPFDTQMCFLQFSSWSYDALKVNMNHLELKEGVEDTTVIPNGIDLKDFYRSVEWDILEVPAMKKYIYFPCCVEYWVNINFNITIRRKTLFYATNLVVPCVAISFLTVLVFFLPSDSGEKMTLCISILLALTVFFLLLAEIIPPTSLVIPLIGKYLLFTMILVTLSIIITVVVLNIHFRSPATHEMENWVKIVFLDILPRLLRMQRPPTKTKAKEEDKSKLGIGGTLANKAPQYTSIPDCENQAFREDMTELIYRGNDTTRSMNNGRGIERMHYPDDITKALEGTNYIVEHMKDEEEYEIVSNNHSANDNY